jgi:hypothetical protein
MNYGEEMQRFFLVLLLAIVMAACGSQKACTEPVALVPQVLEYETRIEAVAGQVFNGEISPQEALTAFHDLQQALVPLNDPQAYSNLLRVTSLKLDCYTNFAQQMVNRQRSDYASIYSACHLEVRNYQAAYDSYLANCK